MWSAIPGCDGLGQVKMFTLYDRFEPGVDMQFIQYMLNVVTSRSFADTHSGRDLRSTLSIGQ